SMSASFNNSMNPVWAELVEALSFFCDQKKSSPSTSSGRTVPVYKGQRFLKTIDVERRLEARPIRRRLVREPGILPLGVTPRCLLTCRDRFVECCPAEQIFRKLAHPDRPHHGQVRVELAGKQSLDLAHRAFVDHSRGALVAPRIEPFARREQDQRPKLDAGRYPSLALLLPLADRPAGRQDDLERAVDPRRVRRLEPGCGLRIEGSELQVIVSDIGFPH